MKTLTRNLNAIRATATVAYQPETIEAAANIPAGTISAQSHDIGMHNAEPLILALDGLIRYAKAHKRRFESTLSEDYMLGPQFLATIQGLRGLLNGDGAVAHERNRSTDSKDNGACESMFWAAMAAAGFTEADLI